MHEVAIAENIVSEVARLIAAGTVTGIPRAVRVQVGRLSTVVPECLDMMFSVVSEGTCLEGARLEIEVVPARAVCQVCGGGFDISQPAFSCPECSGGDIRIVSGTELKIRSVEVA